MLVWKVAICLVGTATGARIEEAYVYPRILEERSSDGLKLVSVDGKMTLRLEKASVLADTLLMTSYDNNGQMTHTLIQAEEIEKHHYRDRDRHASLMVRDTENGLEMTGMVDAVTRIEPVLTAPRSLDGSLPHRLHTMADEDLERLKKIATPIKTPMASLLTPSWMWFDPHWLEAKQEVSIISDSEHHKGMTREQICAYVVVLMTAVNMRFDQTSYPTLQFRVVQIVTTTEKRKRRVLFGHPLPVTQSPKKRVRMRRLRLPQVSVPCSFSARMDSRTRKIKLHSEQELKNSGPAPFCCLGKVVRCTQNLASRIIDNSEGFCWVQLYIITLFEEATMDGGFLHST
uniref:Putative metalloprotease n=1 Tax=Ixodes ricinus TaxID=34613 RepID=A0A0K8RK72_IXORI